jgi:hypothetical protein
VLLVVWRYNSTIIHALVAVAEGFSGDGCSGDPLLVVECSLSVMSMGGWHALCCAWGQVCRIFFCVVAMKLIPCEVISGGGMLTGCCIMCCGCAA